MIAGDKNASVEYPMPGELGQAVPLVKSVWDRRP